jgi:hypothetical protein
VTFHYRQQDAPAVLAVAPQVNNLYATLRRKLGLPLKAWEEKLVIEVSVTHPPGVATPWLGVPDPIRVPSPAVYLAPVDLTDAELLAQSIALPLLEQVLAQASKHHAIGAAWQPLLDGLRLWQVWDLELPLAAWREDIVKWLYVDLPTSIPGQPVVLPERYTALCAAHRLWLASPVQLHIPLLCAERERGESHSSSWDAHDPLTRLDQVLMAERAREQWHSSLWDARDPLTRLDQILMPVHPGDAHWSNRHAINHPGQAVALATLLEYAVAAYGRERLPALVAGLGQYENWDMLLPAVYGVSPAEFEAGWQAYLAARYDVH